MKWKKARTAKKTKTPANQQERGPKLLVRTSLRARASLPSPDALQRRNS
jgi:hypothetical protein